MADGEGVWLSTPVTLDGVNITGANTAALDLDIDIIVSERLGVELLLLEVLPGLRAVDLEAGELLGDVGHRVCFAYAVKASAQSQSAYLAAGTPLSWE